MLVKLAPMGEETREFSLGEGASVSNLLEAAGVEADGRSIRINSEEATMSDALKNGDVVSLISKVEGGVSL